MKTGEKAMEIWKVKRRYDSRTENGRGRDKVNGLWTFVRVKGGWRWGTEKKSGKNSVSGPVPCKQSLKWDSWASD